MPCGGIFPSKGPGTKQEGLDPGQGGCWICDRGGCDHFCLEWDTHLHRECIPDFLKSQEGMIVMEHGHTIHIQGDD